MKKLKDFLNYLFPDESLKIIAFIVIIIIIVLSSIFTFVIVKNSRNTSVSNDEKDIKIIEKKEFELIEPKYYIEKEYKFDIFYNMNKDIREEDYQDLFKYHEFGDYTDYYLNLEVYKKLSSSLLHK